MVVVNVAAAVAATCKALGMPGRAMPTVLGQGNFAQRVLHSVRAPTPARRGGKMRRSGTTRTSSTGASAVVVARRTVTVRKTPLERR